MNDFVKIPLPVEPGYFYTLPMTDGTENWFLFLDNFAISTQFNVGAVAPLSGCMFDVRRLTITDENSKINKLVGFNFSSQFQVINGGGYLISFMNQGRAKANSVEVLLKTEELVIYNYPNRGTLVITPRLSNDVRTIFEEQ